MALFGTLGEFDQTKESWLEYSERLQQFFVANEVEDADRRRAIFITVVGASTYSLLKNLLAPVLPTQRTLEQLLEILTAHFEPAPSEIVERFKFNSRVRKMGESVSTFIAELRSLAKHCNYANVLDEMLRDRLVCGINDEAIQKKLLSVRDLTLNRASEIAVSMEAAARNASDLRGDTPAEVFLVRQRADTSSVKPRSESRSGNRSSANERCYCCGEKGHKSPTCRFKKCVCHACGKTGHLAKMCRSAVGNKNVHSVEKVPDSSPDEPLYDLFSVSGQVEAPPAFKAKVEIQGVPVIMEVDTGAPFSILPFEFYKRHESVFPCLTSTSVKLRSFTKHLLKIAGAVDVTVKYKEKKLTLPVLIVEQCSAMLMGRNWIMELNVLWEFSSVFTTNALQAGQGPLTLQEVLNSHQELFSSGLGCVRNVSVHLNRVSSVEPKFYKARPVPYAYLHKVEEEIARLQHLGVLQAVTHSEWATPVVPVLKSNGKIRLCGDFKLTANVATVLEQYPLPNVEDLFARLSGGVTFSKIDLSDAYCQLKLDDASQDILVINTHKGLFKYTRLPFGVASAPAIFQREMDKLLQGHERALCYLDDLLVTGNSTTDHLQNLNKVLSTLQAAGIKLHPAKCSFMQKSVEYLGHRIDAEGLHPIQSKIDAIVKAPEPTNVDELRSFLGLLTYYGKFLPNMSTLLAPLYQLLHKNQPWKWGEGEKISFRKAKQQLSASSLLVHFDENKEVQLQCDASPYGVGAVLSHPSANGDRPVAFASRSLTKAERNYSQIEREALSLIFGVTRYRKYLLGRNFTLVTDHQPLVSLLSEKRPIPPMAASRIQRWGIVLSAYSYRIIYRKGAMHANADACSRLPIEATAKDPPKPADVVLLLEAIDDSPVTVEHFRRELRADPFLVKVKQFIQQGWPKSMAPEFRPFSLCRAELSVQDGIIFRASRVFVPEKFRKYVLAELHAGHQGMCVLKALARQTVWWPNVGKDIEQVVRSCTICQVEAPEPASCLAPWPYTKVPWSRIHIDHAGPFENQILLLVIDAATKWLEVVPVASTSSKDTISALGAIFSRFGLPHTVVSDNGTSFVSQEFTNFLQRNGIIHVRTAPYHPESNGQVERAVRSVKSTLRKIKGGTLQERLNKFLFHYRISPQATTGLSPARAMFNRPIRSRLDLLRPETKTVSEVRPKFQAEDSVWCRNYGRGPRWVPGEVSSPVGKVMSRVVTPLGEVVRHQDQMRERVEASDSSDQADQSAISEPVVETDSVPPAPAADEPQKLRRSQRFRKPPERLDL